MFNKIFDTTFTGSMYGVGPVIHSVWSFIISKVGHDHYVELNPAVVAGHIGQVSEEEVEAAIEFLSSPDPRSRSKEQDGRRLIPAEGFLYLVVNHEKYRSIHNEEDRREYFRVKKQEARKREQAVQAGTEDAAIPTLAEVVTEGQMHGSTEDLCIRFFNWHNVHNAWLNSYGRIIDWRLKLTHWRDRDRKPVFQNNGGGNGTPAPGRINPVAQKLALEEEISMHPANRESTFFCGNPTDLQKADLKAKRQKVRELTTLIANGGSCPNPTQTSTPQSQHP